jgi:hypothetical protein
MQPWSGGSVPPHRYAPRTEVGKVFMGEVASRFLQTIRLERKAFVWMDFNDRATGDALILVGVTQILMFAGLAGGLRSVLNVRLWDFLIQLVLAGLVQWLLYSAIAWALVRYVVQGSGKYSTYLRFTGFAYPTTLVTLAVAIVLGETGIISFIAGFVWFLAIIARGIQYESDLSPDRAWFVAIGALGGLLIVDAIFNFSPIT